MKSIPYGKAYAKPYIISNKNLETVLNNLMPSHQHEKTLNGLQIHGCEKVTRIICGVSLCLELIEEALDHNADAIIVHHGWYHPPAKPICDFYGARLAKILANKLNIYGYHLPMDTSRLVGHNVHMANLLQAERVEFVSLNNIADLGVIGCYRQGLALPDLSSKLESILKTKVASIKAHDKPIYRLGICSGAGQKFIKEMADYKCDAYLSGEISEQTTIFARELPISYLYAGHHATERIGMKFLTRGLRKMGLRAKFIDVDNPA